MNRRSFLTWAGAGAATAAIGHRFVRSAHAAGFGEFPAAAQSLALPANMRAKRVLEIFCYGGLSPWETLYLVRDYGTPASAHPNTQFHAMDHSDAIANCAHLSGLNGEIGQGFACLGRNAASLWPLLCAAHVPVDGPRP